MLGLFDWPIIKNVFLPKMSWISSAKFVKVRGSQSPYDGDHIYWTLRSARHSYYATRITKLLKKQDGACPWCKHKFTTFDDDLWEVDHIKPRSLGGKDIYNNLQLLHNHCHKIKTRTDGSRGHSLELSEPKQITKIIKPKQSSSGQALQEPDEGKLSRPVLETSAGSDDRT